MNTKVPLKERYGFQSFGMRMLCRFARLFCRCSCDVPDDLAKLEEPVVFVCNHHEVFGPLAVAANLPLRYRFWINEAVIHATKNREKLVVGTQHIFPWMNEKIALKAVGAYAGLAEKFFRPFEPIPVDREQPAKLLSTLRKSVKALQNGDSIIIFPETGIPHYSHGGVNEFFSGFAMLGEVFYRTCGKALRFCAVYVDKKHRRLSFGQPVSYGGNAEIADYQQLSDQLRNDLLQMSKEAGITENA